MRQPQQAFLLENEAGADKNAGGTGQEEANVEVPHVLRWRRHCVVYAAVIFGETR